MVAEADATLHAAKAATMAISNRIFLIPYLPSPPGLIDAKQYDRPAAEYNPKPLRAG